MTIPSELEIKYECLAALTADDVERVTLHPFRLGERTAHDLLDTLLDTPSRAFGRQKVALRLRRDGPTCILTLKGPKQQVGQALRRDEIEVHLGDGREDDPSTWPEPIRAKVLEWSAGERLHPLFTIRNQRISWPVYLEQRRVAELALDRGQIEAAGLTEPLHEIEIELKEGTAEEIETIAARLAASLPLRHATRGKAERGFALLIQALQSVAPENGDATDTRDRHDD